MSKIRGIMIAGVTLMASALTAQSADLYGAHGGRGSIKDDHSYMPATSGCATTYARIDGGYSTFDRPSMSQVGIDDLVWARAKDAGNLGGGIGRYFTCNIRGDLTVDHRFKSDMTGFNANAAAPNFGRMTWGYESTTLLANMYYDFNSGARFTPYIGFGVGLVANNFSAGRGVVAAGQTGVPISSSGNPVTVGGGSNWHAAGAAMTGFVFKVSDRMKFDTGYRFLYLGANDTGQTKDTRFGGVGGTIHVENLHAHEFRIGLRYDIR